MSAARCQNRIRLDFVIFLPILLACCIQTAIQFLVSFFVMSNVHPTCHEFMKNNSKLSHAAAIRHERQVTWCREADVYEYHFQGGWTLSLPICQCVSEVRGEFLCVLVWFRLVSCGFLGGHAMGSPYASQLMVGLSRVFIKGSGEVERAEWIKAVLTPVQRALLV